MTVASYNSFTKSPTSKTGYTLTNGQPIVGEKIYLIKLGYVHHRSPAFSLVVRGKHVSSFFAAGPAFIGDHKQKTLIVFLRENGLDLFEFNQSPAAIRTQLLDGNLNEILFQARQEAATA